jgi:hypothetical protein
MATVKEIGELRVKFEKTFNEFFKDKYDDEATLAVIFKDLFDLIRNGCITEVTFCVYDNISGQITDGYVFDIVNKSDNPINIKKEVSFNVPKLEKTNEKLLFVKLSDEYTNNMNKINEKIESLDNEWDYINKPNIQQTGLLKDFHSISDLKIQIKEIDGSSK